MRLVGVILEPPFHPASWSGSAHRLFGSLAGRGLLATALDVSLPPLEDALFKLRNGALPLARWRQKYHADPARFRAHTRRLSSLLRTAPAHDAVLQIGAWCAAPAVADVPCFSYHDGNAALWYRMYGGDVLDPALVAEHVAWERELYSRMSGIFVMSQWLGDSFVRDFGVPAERVHVVGAGANFDALPPLRRHDFTRPTFLFVGRDFERKGGPLLLRAFEHVRASRPDARLLIVGPRPRAPAPGVEWHGYLSRDDAAQFGRLSALYGRATTVVLPSLYEPFGISLLEGMAHSLPCVAVRQCAMPEIVLEGRTGLLAEPGDVGSLAEVLLAVAADPIRAAAWGAAGRRRVEQRFNWTAVERAICSIIAEQIGEQIGAGSAVDAADLPPPQRPAGARGANVPLARRH